MAEAATWTDRLAAVVGFGEPPQARAHLTEWLAPVEDDDNDDGDEETNVIELAAFVDFANRVMS